MNEKIMKKFVKQLINEECSYNPKEDNYFGYFRKTKGKTYVEKFYYKYIKNEHVEVDNEKYTFHYIEKEEKVLKQYKRLITYIFIVPENIFKKKIIVSYHARFDYYDINTYKDKYKYFKKIKGSNYKKVVLVAIEHLDKINKLRIKRILNNEEREKSMEDIKRYIKM